MTLSIVFPSRSARALLTLGVCAAAGLALAQTPIGQLSPDGITIKGRVADDFDGKFVLSDDSGKVLVEPRGGLPPGSKIAVGETLTVTGLPRGRTFEATRIARERGEVVFTAAEPLAAPPSSAPPAGAPPVPTIGQVSQGQIDAVLKANGLTAVGLPDRKKKHIEIPAKDASGTNVVVSLDLFGRIWEIEDADEGDENPPVRITSPAQAVDVVRQAGYRPTDRVETRKHHFEVIAQNQAGELVELHLDLSGHIYKKSWIR